MNHLDWAFVELAAFFIALGFVGIGAAIYERFARRRSLEATDEIRDELHPE